jgi:hypothetical protein
MPTATDYECVLSGLLPNDAETVPEDQIDEELEDLPIGWTEVRLRRRIPNVPYVEIQAVKQAMFQQELTKVPKEHRRDSAGVVRIQIDAMFASLEARTPAYVVDEETVYVAPPTRESEAGGLTNAQMQIFQALDIDWVGLDQPEDGDDNVVDAVDESTNDERPEAEAPSLAPAQDTAVS